MVHCKQNIHCLPLAKQMQLTLFGLHGIYVDNRRDVSLSYMNSQLAECESRLRRRCKDSRESFEEVSEKLI